MQDSTLNGVVLVALAALGAISLLTGYVVPGVRASLDKLFNFIEWLLWRSRRTRRIWKGTWKRRR